MKSIFKNIKRIFNLKKIKLSLGIVVMVSLNCSNTSKDIIYNSYELIKVDSFKVRKHATTDILSKIDIRNGKLIYYSRDSVCLVISDIKTHKTKALEFIEDKQNIVLHPYSINFTYLNDSSIILNYESRSPFVDQKLILMNISSGSFSYPFNLQLPNLLTKSKYPNDEDLLKALNNRAKYPWFNPSNYNMPINLKDSSIFLTLLAGDILNRGEKQRAVTSSVIKINPQNSSSLPEMLPISFSLLNPVFNDSVNVKDNFYEMMNPLTSVYNDSTFLMYYNGSQNLIIYNMAIGNYKIINVKIPFLKTSDYPLSFASTKKSEHFSFGKIVSHLENPYILRNIAFPITYDKYNYQKINSFFVPILFNKDLKCLGACRNSELTVPIYGADAKYFYGYDRNKSESNDSWFYIYKYIIGNFKRENGYLEYDYSSEYINTESSVKTYLTGISTELCKLDTIPVIFTTTKPSTLNKVGIFLSELQKLQKRHKSLLIVSPNVTSYSKFTMNYKIKESNLNHYEHNNLFFKKFPFTKMGYFFKTAFGYKYREYEIEEINNLLHIIDPTSSIIGDMCVPIRD